jgi:hypothetical protein
MNEKQWVKFWIESNQVFGMVESLSEWERVKRLFSEAYKNTDIYDLKEDIYPKELPNFGQRREHKGDRTLRDFFQENGMDM